MNGGMNNAAFTAFFLLLMTPAFIGGGFMTEKNASFSAIDGLHLDKQDRRFIEAYLLENQKIFAGIRQNDRSRFTFADAVFHRYDLPLQLKYLAVIESDLRTNAVSRVGAAGPWQLMPETARLLGLKIAGEQDERREFNKSTRAAARYLKDLYAEYNDWLLVLAAYNSGEGPVNHAIRKAGSRNFWLLQNYLPSESRDHVKKFIATLIYFEGPLHAAAFSLSGGALVTAQTSYQKRTHRLG
ncbi:MAG TPA: lytic transglycosylase domain-containing protein [Puia sp.]|nr:lytic transglycosylase domain-containing protein [Puia sp.]